MESSVKPPDTISLEFLARQQSQLLDEVRAGRADNREIRLTFTLISEHFSRQERRLSELRDDFETMIKLEIGGAIVNLETRLEIEFDKRLGAVEARFDAADVRLAALESGQAKLELGQAQLERGQAKLERGQAKLENGQAQLEHGQTQMNAKLDAILAALQTA